MDKIDFDSLRRSVSRVRSSEPLIVANEFVSWCTTTVCSEYSHTREACADCYIRWQAGDSSKDHKQKTWRSE